MPQARKKATKAPKVQNQMSRRIEESVFLLSILVAVYLLACIASYDPLDPGPFNTTASAQIHNTGRVLGAWLANFFLFLSGYVAYAVPLIVVFAGWSASTEPPLRRIAEAGVISLWLERAMAASSYQGRRGFKDFVSLSEKSTKYVARPRKRQSIWKRGGRER